MERIPLVADQVRELDARRFEGPERLLRDRFFM
jgi:hypothetical protein